MHKRLLTLTTVAIATVAALANSAAAAVAHRYSFTGNLNDSIGAAHGTMVDAGNPTAAFTGGQLDLSGNAGQGSNAITEDAYVDLPNGIISAAASGGTSGALSIELWATVSTTRTWQRFVDFGTSNDGEDTSNGAGASPYVYIAANSGRWTNGLATETHEPNGPANEVGLQGPFPNNVQVHVVGTYDHNDVSAGANGTIRLYLDGVPVGNAAIAALLDLRTLTDVNNWIGRSQWPDPVFDGLINELRIHDTALPASEVLSHAVFGPDVLNPGGNLQIEVNKNTGAVTLKNTATAPITLDFYRLSSAGGALSLANWNSLDDQNFSAVDGPDAGAVAGDSVGEGWDQAGGSNANQLVEQFIGETGSSIGSNQTVSLGNAFNTSIFGNGVDGDLQFEFGVNNGPLASIPVAYVGSGGQPGDFDADGDVDGNDFLVWQRGFGTTHNAGTLATWKANFGAPAEPAAAAVPEPLTFHLLALACLGALAIQRSAS